MVKQVENLGGWGMIGILEHIEGFSSRYGHLDQFEVKAGDKVAKGQVIGRVGILVNPQARTSTMRSEKIKIPSTRPNITKKCKP